MHAGVSRGWRDASRRRALRWSARQWVPDPHLWDAYRYARLALGLSWSPVFPPTP